MNTTVGRSFSVLTIGSALDQLTTHIILKNPETLSVNPYASWLILNNKWLSFDLTILIMLIFPLSIILYTTSDAKNKNIILFTPALIGIIRIFIAAWNLLLFIV